MPKDINNTTISGTLADEPDLRYTKGDTAVCNLRIETETWYMSGGEWNSRTSYFTLEAWGQRAERISQRFQQGDRLWATGELRVNSWEDNSGERQYRTVVSVDDFGPISGGANAPAAQPDPQPEPQDQRRSQKQSRQGNGRQSQGGSQQQDTFEPDDELPF